MRQYNDALIDLVIAGKNVSNTKEILNKNLMLPTNELCTSQIRLMSPYYLVGELMFSLAFSNDLNFINHYSKFWNNITEGDEVRSAYWWQAKYGHGFDQIEYVVKKLKDDSNSRQAIIHLKHPIDYNGKDEICTMTLQFFIRNEKLQMIVNMRSNDVIRGLPYDHAVFVMLQQYIANKLNIKIEDYYYHNAGSFHLYNDDFTKLNCEPKNKNYLIEFSKEFFDQSRNLLILEKACRTDTIMLDSAIDLVKNNIDGDLCKTIAAIMIMYKKSADDKKYIFNKLLRNVNCGLKDLLVDYHENLRSKKNGN